MIHQPVPNTLLDEIVALGEQLQAALLADDVDTFIDLIARRGVIVERLQTIAVSASSGEAWRDHAVTLTRQYKAIMAAAAARETHLVARQGTLKQVQNANMQYQGHPARPQFLNKELRG